MVTYAVVYCTNASRGLSTIGEFLVCFAGAVKFIIIFPKRYEFSCILKNYNRHSVDIDMIKPIDF